MPQSFTTNLPSAHLPKEDATVLVWHVGSANPTRLDADHYRVAEDYLYVYRGDDEVAQFPPGRWSGVVRSQ